jgi:hypothetical protein
VARSLRFSHRNMFEPIHEASVGLPWTVAIDRVLAKMFASSSALVCRSTGAADSSWMAVRLSGRLQPGGDRLDGVEEEISLGTAQDLG